MNAAILVGFDSTLPLALVEKAEILFLEVGMTNFLFGDAEVLWDHNVVDGGMNRIIVHSKQKLVWS